MKKVLTVVWHLSFVIFMTLLLQLTLLSGVSVKSFKGDTDYKISLKDYSNSFVESDMFNQMFGVSVSDILNYGALNYEYENTPELHNSVSANSIGGGDVKGNLGKYKDILGRGNTNLNYYINAVIDDESYLFSNVLDEDSSLNDIHNSIKASSGMYIYYNNDKDEYKTNTKIMESTIEKLIANSGYSEASKIVLMVGLNSNLQGIDDNYKTAMFRYSSYTEGVLVKIILIVVFAFIYLLLLGILAYTTGVTKNTENKKSYVKPSSLDYIPVELRLLYLLILCVPVSFFFDFFDDVYRFVLDLYVNNIIGLSILVGLVLLIINIIFAFFFFGFIRRVRTGLFIKTSLLYKLFCKVTKKAQLVFSNQKELVKAILTTGIVILVNVLLSVYWIKFENILCLLILFIVDIVFIVLTYKNLTEQSKIYKTLADISDGDIAQKVNPDEVHFDNKKWAFAVNNIGEAVNKAVESSMKNEKMKADLITNVSHDIKTPLTSIINYVDLLKKQDIDDETIRDYINVLDEKSQRLKQLTDDLVEASKISSGNVVLNMERINLKELILQATGEFVDKFEEKNLSFNGTGPEDGIYVNADSRSIYRVIENLFNNICKYALEGTRVYLDIARDNGQAVLTIKNISANPLNISAEELTERFIRGDESRTTEGSGLGLSIAKSLTEAMGGSFELNLDGDLFKVIIKFAEIA